MMDASEPQTTDMPRATLANWREAPYNRWAFNHVSELVPSALIRCERQTSKALPAQPQDVTTLAIRHHGQTLPLHDWLEQTHTDCLVVLKQGRIVHEYYRSGQAADVQHIWMSVSKSLTGLVAGILIEQQLLDPAAPLAHLLPELAHTVYADASVQDLLDMRIDVAFDEDYLAQDGPMQLYRKAQLWLPWQSHDQRMHLPEFFTTLDQRSDTARHFHYVSPNVDICGWLLERISGRPFAELVQHHIWQPMGAEQDAYITVDGIGTPRCAGGFCATARDMTRLGRLFVTGGKAHGHTIIPPAWLHDIYHNGDREAWDKGDFAGAFGEPAMHYRNYWYVSRGPHPLIFAVGVFGQNLFIYPEDDLVIAKASSQPEADDDAMYLLTHAGIRAIRKVCAAG